MVIKIKDENGIYRFYKASLTKKTEPSIKIVCSGEQSGCDGCQICLMFDDSIFDGSCDNLFDATCSGEQTGSCNTNNEYYVSLYSQKKKCDIKVL